MKKLWDKNLPLDQAIEQFTIGNDAILDMDLAPYDIIGSIAHVKMLRQVNLLTSEEEKKLTGELRVLYRQVESGAFIIEPGIEDIHSQVEKMLTDKLGETGEKVHTARSRNDQIILDIRLFTRDKLAHIRDRILILFNLLVSLSEKHKDHLMPGYTHFQVAMPSSFGLWFGSFAESLADDVLLLNAAYRVTNQNPLGSAAGYGSSFPINREITTRLLGFDGLTVNSIYAQAGRGKTEKTTAFALASVASSLGRLAMDAVLFMNQNFGFMELPDAYTTGSSIMPHKKNPDAFELVRARCNKMQALPNEIQLIMGNLPTGYHRDFQLLKESYLPAFNTLDSCLKITILLLQNLHIRKDILGKDIYRYIYSVEEVNRWVSQGIPFREAYRKVAEEIRTGQFHPPEKVAYTHLGSIGNPGNDKIKNKMDIIVKEVDYHKAEQSIRLLIKQD